MAEGPFLQKAFLSPFRVTSIIHFTFYIIYLNVATEVTVAQNMTVFTTLILMTFKLYNIT